MTKILDIDNLSVAMRTANPREMALVLDGVSLSLHAGQMLGLVGESGSGKSMTCLAVMGLLPAGGRQLSGRIRLEGEDLTTLSEAALGRKRGKVMSMIFQDPMSSLNPLMRVGQQIAEVLRHHDGLSRRAAKAQALALLARVGIEQPDLRFGQYPHEFSGGMCQRVMIAMALACRPRLLIADEPTTALDVSIQAQIVALIDELRREAGTAVIFVSHNLALVSQIADEIAVMYAGRVVEHGPTRQVLRRPAHPYTRGLLQALPQAGLTRLTGIEGAVPPPHLWPQGCRFAPRCAAASDLCRSTQPALAPRGAGHFACHHPREVAS